MLLVEPLSHISNNAMHLQQLLLSLLEVTTEASIPKTTHNIEHGK